MLGFNMIDGVAIETICLDAGDGSIHYDTKLSFEGGQSCIAHRTNSPRAALKYHNALVCGVLVSQAVDRKGAGQIEAHLRERFNVPEAPPVEKELAEAFSQFFETILGVEPKNS